MQRKGSGLYFVAIEKHLYMSLRLFVPGLCGKYLVLVIKIMSGMSGGKKKRHRKDKNPGTALIYSHYIIEI